MLSRASRAEARTLLDGFATWDADPEARALAFVRPGGRVEAVSGRELRERAARSAAGLTALGVRRGDVVVIAHSEGLEAVYAFWGALLIGAIPSMFPSSTEKLDPAVYRTNMKVLVRHSGARVVLSPDELGRTLADTTGCTTIGFARLRDTAAPEPPAFEPLPEDVAFLQHSSGTTGLQKGVALAHRAVLNQLASYSDALRLARDDVVVSWLPLYHDMGLIAGFLLPIVQRIPLVLMSPFDWVKRPALLLRAIHEYGGTLSWLPNFAFNHCARRILDREIEGVSLEGVRAFINCSEPVLESSCRAFVERFASHGARQDQLAVSYAMAENVFAVTQTPFGTPTRVDVVDRRALGAAGRAVPVREGVAGAGSYVSCGPPISGVAVRIEGAPADRCVGEIQVRSDCLLTGYHRRPDADAESFDDGWYRTGDLGYLADGEIYVVGRKKDLIITGGKNVHPHDLEAVVGEVAGVHPGRAVAFGVPDEAEGTELIAVVAEVDVEHSAQRKAIGTAIRQALARQTGIVANFVDLVDAGWLLKTSSGKIARAANREKWLAGRKTF